MGIRTWSRHPLRIRPVGVETVPELGGHVAQLAGIEPSGRVQQGRFSVPQRLAAYLFGGAGDDTHMGEVDLAGGEVPASDARPPPVHPAHARAVSGWLSAADLDLQSGV